MLIMSSTYLNLYNNRNSRTFNTINYPNDYIEQ